MSAENRLGTGHGIGRAGTRKRKASSKRIAPSELSCCELQAIRAPNRRPWRVDMQTSDPIALLPTRISLRRWIVVVIHSSLASALEPIGPITRHTSDELR